MFLGGLYRTYCREGQEHELTPRQLLKIMVYAYMNRIYSSRAIETACRRGVNFMWLLEGKRVTDHATIAQFRSLHFAPCAERIMAEVTEFLHQLGEITGETIFIDGTKIEACANKYTFVWKKSVSKNLEKLLQKLADLVGKCEELYGLKLIHHNQVKMKHVKKLRKKLYALKNGQLKAGYNIQHGVDSEYIVWLTAGSQPTDTNTLIPFLEEMKGNLSFRYKKITADAGYESEENYRYLEKNGQLLFIKPANYEILKTRKYQGDIGRIENMEYDESADCYTCRNGKQLLPSHMKRVKTKTGYERETTVYTCQGCDGCPHKKECIKGNRSKKPLEERSKVLCVSKKFNEYRKEDLERIVSEKGCKLRMNQSIQAEGSFGNLKQDSGFRRFLCRGIVNEKAEAVLLALAQNMNKLHHKIQGERTAPFLFLCLAALLP